MRRAPPTHATNRPPRTSPVRAAWLVALASLAGDAAAADFRAEGGPVAVAVYDFEVASMCGLVTERVHRGFRRYLAALVDESGMDRAAFEQARMAGWTAADREWANRGLGGFRGWCASEGVAAATTFAAHAPANP